MGHLKNQDPSALPILVAAQSERVAPSQRINSFSSSGFTRDLLNIGAPLHNEQIGLLQLYLIICILTENSTSFYCNILVIFVLHFIGLTCLHRDIQFAVSKVD